MATKTSQSQTSTKAIFNQNRRRQIPLTAFTLLTVPEEPMLSTYLQTKETIDISLMQRMMLPGESWAEASLTPSSTQEASLAQQPASLRSAMYSDSTFRELELELQLDKSMAAITATESPFAVLKTIEWAKSSRFGARQDHPRA